jgi:heparinase II/III-like protein
LSSLTTKIKKLKGLKIDEIGVRAAQQLAILSERGGWSRQVNLPTDAELLDLIDSSAASLDVLREQFLRKGGPYFFSSFDAKEQTVSEFRRRWPQAERQIVAAADLVAEGTFNLLGFRELKLGNQIDWHLEPMSGKRTPLRHWSRLNYLDATLAGDKKVTWELNRHQYFLTLGRAYWLTGDERYAQVFASHITSWMDENPPKLGINWASSLEIAFRSISWLWALHFFAESPALSPDLLTRITKFFYLNASHLETYLSTYFSPNTHLTGEALGLFYLGLMLPEFKSAARWRDLGLAILVSQLGRHVQPDGVYFEQSTYYHRYTSDFYLHLAIMLRRNGLAWPPELERKLKLLLDHLLHVSRPDGTTPFLGDDDGGRLIFLDQRPQNDFRSLLATGAVLFNRSDYKFVAGEAAEETLWLLGVEGVRTFDQIVSQPPENQSVAFPDGGYYVMRDDWSSTANYLLFDCGPHGTANCGHAHADALAIELAAQGQTILVDPGTFTYTGDRQMRDWFRSSIAHNTLTIDRQSSSLAAGPFSWKTRTACEPLAWIDHQHFTYVSGRHDGYKLLAKPGIHTRSILFVKHGYWIMHDEVELSGKHDVELWFHFETGVAPDLLQIASFADNGTWTEEKGWVSHCYGEKAPARVRVFSTTADARVGITTFLLPRPANNHDDAKVKQIKATGGRAFEVQTENRRDIVILREPGAKFAQALSVVSDFNCAWLRFQESSSTPEELLVLGGQRLEFAGNKIVESSERVESSWLTRDARSGTYVRN